MSTVVPSKVLSTRVKMPHQKIPVCRKKEKADGPGVRAREFNKPGLMRGKQEEY